MQGKQREDFLAVTGNYRGVPHLLQHARGNRLIGAVIFGQKDVQAPGLGHCGCYR